ncbi:hypothetical protein FOZG_06469 [Fusarium oxysporum Fo47]|uniref:Uncharacterized protein n=1 Tax=Fusarium oxysporum Fo47 TaxID=660027 RepID=W9K9L6_FUSOX|nr:hypothetical protein FOZG_06469 [Fusarium oxysporum Fo47]
MKRSTIFLRNESRPMMTPGLPKASVRGTQKWASGEMEMESSRSSLLKENCQKDQKSPMKTKTPISILTCSLSTTEKKTNIFSESKTPRWDWGRDAQGDLWYWQVSGTAGHATETWRFENKGEYAYGNEPLDFWDDWYDDRGDEAEATPYGWNLVASSECHELGSEIPQRGTCESLRRYSIDNDPVVSDVYVRMNLPKPADFEVWSNVPWNK